MYRAPIIQGFMLFLYLPSTHLQIIGSSWPKRNGEKQVNLPKQRSWKQQENVLSDTLTHCSTSSIYHPSLPYHPLPVALLLTSLLGSTTDSQIGSCPFLSLHFSGEEVKTDHWNLLLVVLQMGCDHYSTPLPAMKEPSASLDDLLSVLRMHQGQAKWS